MKLQRLGAGKQEDIYPAYFERDEQEGKAIRKRQRRTCAPKYVVPFAAAASSGQHHLAEELMSKDSVFKTRFGKV